MGRALCATTLVLQNGYTALHRAANGGFVDVVKALVASKANLTVLDKVGLLLAACFALQPGPYPLRV
jgi:ankyrin repeat protein